MLERLDVRGFQAHRKFILEFDPQVTSIIGPTDEGKSTLLRALRWVCLNQLKVPAEDLVNWDSKEAKASLKVDGHKIRRIRGKGKNLYELDGKTYKSFSSIVPEDISNILNVDNLNFQRQLDPHFWFNLTPGQLSKALNEIINLGSIDKVLDNIAREHRQAKARVASAEEELKATKEELDKLKWVPEFLENHDALELERTALQELPPKIAGLKFLVLKAKAAMGQRRIAIQAMEEAHKLGVLAVRRDHLQYTVDSLRELLTEHKKRTTVMSIEVPDIKNLQDLYLAIKTKKRKVGELRELIIGYRKCQIKIDQLSAARSKAVTELKRKTPKRCPTCKQKLPPRTTISLPT